MTLMFRPARLHRIHVALLILIFVMTRGWAIAAGFHYLGNETTWLLQIMDLEVLHHHLLRGLLHLHGQPPLFNMAIGLAEKVAGEWFGKVMLGLQLGFSLAAGVAVYLTLVRLGVGAWVGFGVSLFLLLNPALLLFEFDALYTVMVYALHCFIALALVCFLGSRSNRALGWFAGLALTLTLLRSSYPWIWVAMLFGLLWWQMPDSRRQVLRVGVVAVLLALLWPAKNYLLFRHFTSTTWGPYSVSRHWPGPPYQEPVQGWVRQGLLPTFDKPEDVQVEPQWLDRVWTAPKTGFPELDDSRKSGGGANWNALNRLRMLDAQAKDDRYLLRHDPAGYAQMAFLGVILYFRPSSDYFTLGYPWFFWDPSVEQYERLGRIGRVADAVCCGIITMREVPVQGGAQAAHIPGGGRLTSVCAGAVAAYLLVLACATTLFGRWKMWEGRMEQKIWAMVTTFTIAYVFVVVSLVEVGENMRFRFETHALVVMVAAVFAQRLWDWKRRGV